MSLLHTTKECYLGNGGVVAFLSLKDISLNVPVEPPVTGCGSEWDEAAFCPSCWHWATAEKEKGQKKVKKEEVLHFSMAVTHEEEARVWLIPCMPFIQQLCKAKTQKQGTEQD